MQNLRRSGTLTLFLKFCRWVPLMKLPVRHKTDCVAKLQKGENNNDLDYKQMHFSTKIVDRLIRE